MSNTKFYYEESEDLILEIEFEGTVDQGNELWVSSNRECNRAIWANTGTSRRFSSTLEEALSFRIKYLEQQISSLEKKKITSPVIVKRS